MLNQIPLFSGLSNAELSKLELFCQERFIKSGEILFSEGDDATALYIVKEGKLKTYKERSEGEIVLGFAEKNDMIGEMAIFDVLKTRMASVKAIIDSNLIVIMNYSILELSKNHSEIYEKILKIIEERRKINSNF